MKFSAAALYYFLDSSTYVSLLDEAGRLQRDRRYPRTSILPFRFSTFWHLYLSCNDQALINATGFDHRTFNLLLQKFKPYYDFYTIDEDTGMIRPKKLREDGKPYGRQRDMCAVGGLGLVLMWYRTKGSCARGLALLFGQTSTPLYRWIQFGRMILLKAIIQDPDAKVSMPSLEDVTVFKNAISDKYPVLDNVWGAVDGLKLHVQASERFYVQNQLYNGWTHGHFLNSLFVFAPNGKICMCVLNAPGTFHDSTMADYSIYKALKKVYVRTGGKVVVNSAFKLGDKDFLVKSSQDITNCDAQQVIFDQAATSVR